MNPKICKFCFQKIYWHLINKEWKPFDDSTRIQPHKCGKLSKEAKPQDLTISELEDLVQRNYNLLVKVISKINDLERKVNNEVHLRLL